MRSMVVYSVLLGLLSGCNQVNNPFVDPYSNVGPITTPSVDAVMAADVPPSIQDRIGAPKVRCAADGSVVHGPLFFEDPFEEHGSEDGKFAWTGEDYFWMVYWRARFMVNLVAYPVSAVVNPPWQDMVSDGNYSCCGRGREFDAEPKVKE